MKKVLIAAAAASMLSLAACNPTPANETAANMADMIDEQADNFEAMADNTTNDTEEAMLENAADNAEETADNIRDNAM